MKGGNKTGKSFTRPGKKGTVIGGVVIRWGPEGKRSKNGGGKPKKY